MKHKIYLYDTTLRDGTQGEEIAFTVEDKLRIAERLDELGIAYLEGGWPGSNPRDIEFFRRAKKLKFKNTKLAAFGSTVHPDQKPENYYKDLLASGAPVVTIFGKSWKLHVKKALKVSLPKNLGLIEQSVRYLKKHASEVIYDAEHFFDGFKDDPDYALQSLTAAVAGGADWIVLCDTNGGTLPHELAPIFQAVQKVLSTPLGIHCHNDAECAVANSLEAVHLGARQVHGTINGYGERCGNANLVSILPNLQLKLGYACVPKKQLQNLRRLSRFVDELANLTPKGHQPYVGKSAFAHKGGMHVSAIQKESRTYEHIDPESVGNRRRVLVSDLSGKANVVYKAAEFGITLDAHDALTQKIVADLKSLENQGYQFEGAEASFEILVAKAMKKYRPAFRLVGFRVIDEKHPQGGEPYSEATIQIEVDGTQEHTAAEGNGPVNALDNALRKALERFYPNLKAVRLVDYKVRVLAGEAGTESRVRVLVESTDGHDRWGTVGVSGNIIQASWHALVDALEYKLLKDAKRTK